MGKCGIELTRSKLGVLHLSVVGAAALVQPRVHGRATVPQRAGAAAHVGVRGVEVLWTLESLVIVPVRVQPAVAVLPLCVRYPGPGQISEQQAVEQASHPGASPASRRLQLPESVSATYLLLIEVNLQSDKLQTTSPSSFLSTPFEDNPVQPAE